MTVREYIGARYVPLFMGEWSSENTYEPLSIVQHQGNSYTSRQYVPTGIAITNESYWAQTGNYNAQIEAYRAEVQEFSDRIDEANENSQKSESMVHGSNAISKNIPFANPEKIYDVFKTYMEYSESNFYYGAPSIFAQEYDSVNNALYNKNIECRTNNGNVIKPISCSALTMLLINGIPYNKSRYANGTVESIDGTPYITSGENICFGGNKNIDWHNVNAMKYWQRVTATGELDGSGSFYSAGLAHWLHDSGMLHEINNNAQLNELAIGDVLFYANTNDFTYEHWQNINHCEIFMGWTSNRVMVVLTTTGNDSATGTKAFKVVRRAANNTLLNTLKFYARFPGTAIPHSNIIAEASSLTYEGSGSHQFARIDLPENMYLDGDKFYTCIFNVSNYSGTNTRINVYGAKSADTANYTQAAGNVYLAQDVFEFAPNWYYCVFHTNATDQGTLITDLDAVRISVTADTAYSISIDKFAMFDTLIQPTTI